MNIVKVQQNIVTTTKSCYLNCFLKVKNRKGEFFSGNLRHAIVITDKGHSVFFAEDQGGPNHFFVDAQGVSCFRETRVRKTWNDQDHASEKFERGEMAIRSVVCRYSSGGNRYFGEFMLIRVAPDFRIWKRVSRQVDFDEAV